MRNKWNSNAWWEYKIYTTTLEDRVFFIKIIYLFLYNPVIPLLRIVPKEIKL